MAALWMAGWLAQMLMIAVAGREALRELNVFQLILIRSSVGLLLLYPLIHRAGGFAAVKTQRLPQHIARNIIHFGAQLGWFFALTLIPIGQVVAIEFTMPIWTAIVAALFLGERMTIWKSCATVLGLVGVIMIVRPATGELNPGQLIALGAAVGFGISIAMVKSLTRTDQAVTIVFYMAAVQIAGSLLPGLYAWTWPSPTVWGWAIVVAFCGTFSLLYDAGAAVCGCHRCGPDGLFAGPAHCARWLAALFRASRCLHGARRRPDPHGKSCEFARDGAGSRARCDLSGLAGSRRYCRTHS